MVAPAVPLLHEHAAFSSAAVSFDADETRAEMPDAVIFAEPHINILLAWNEKVEPRMPDATGFSWVPHYYDLLSLMSSTSSPRGTALARGDKSQSSAIKEYEF